MCKRPAFIPHKKVRGKFAVGMKYEATVLDHLGLLALGKPNLSLYEGQWFEFLDRSGRRWCQIDALLLDHAQNAAIICEIKYQHTPDAWWQLRELYYPVIKAAFPKLHPICLCEIVHYYDAKVEWPERHDLTDSPLRIPHAHKVAVCIFNPRRRANLRSNGVAAAGHHGSESFSEAISGLRQT